MGNREVGNTPEELTMRQKNEESESEGEVIITHIFDSWLAYALHADLVITPGCPGRIDRPGVGTGSTAAD